MPPTNEEINSVWASAAPLDHTEMITLPSGQTARVRRLGLEGVMTSGLLGEADSLTQFVGKQHIRRVRGGKGIPDQDVVDPQALMKDPEALKKIVKLVDQMTPLVVVEPDVLLHFEWIDNGPMGMDTRLIPSEEREPGRVYTDQIGLEDKMYLFNWALGGTRDIQRFRKQSDESLGDVADVEGVEGTPERPHARKRRPRRR